MILGGGYYGQYVGGLAAPTVEEWGSAPALPRPFGGGIGRTKRPPERSPGHRQREIEQQVDELIDSLVAEPSADIPTETPEGVVEQPAVDVPGDQTSPRKPVPLPGPIRAPEPAFVPPIPEPEPWVLRVPVSAISAGDTADDINRLLCCAAAILTT